MKGLPFYLRMMKRIIFLVFLFLLIFSNACKKDKKTSDNINHSMLEKVLIHESADTNYRVIFEIYKEGDSFITRLKYVHDHLLCDCGQELLKDGNSGDILLFNLNDVISGQNNWGDTITSNSFSLKNFRGKGNKFIGFRNEYFPDGHLRYYYGWFQIVNSPNNDTLRIIDMAVNQTEGNSIKAGQKE